ncbi:MAG: hypothetical protein EON58_19995, partial [Alphaproteobacteria bacterium]
MTSSSCAWYRSGLHVAFDPHSKPSTIASTTFKLGWEGGFSVDRASLIYVGERFKDGDGHLKLQIIDGADRLSGVRVYEARVRRSGPRGEWKVFAENLSFAADQPIRIPLELYTADAPYQLRIRGAFVTRSGALKSFVLDDQVTMKRDRQLRSMWDAMAF